MGHISYRLQYKPGRTAGGRRYGSIAGDLFEIGIMSGNETQTADGDYVLWFEKRATRDRAEAWIRDSGGIAEIVATDTMDIGNP